MINSHETFKIQFKEQSQGDSFSSLKKQTGTFSVQPFDPSKIHGVMDLLINGRSLLDQPGEDPIFFLMRDLLFAAEHLTTGEVSARVSFYETPYELVFLRKGDWVYLTFYRIGNFPEVIVKDHRLLCKSLILAICESTDNLLSATLDSNTSALSNSLIVWMDKTTQSLKSFCSTWISSAKIERPLEITIESSRWKEPRTQDGFSFGFKFNATDTDLLTPGRLVGNDLNSLLFKGQLVVHSKNRRRAMGKGFLFLQVEKLLLSVKKLLSAWEERRTFSIRLISHGFSIGLSLDIKDSLTITISNHLDDDSMIAIKDITPWEYADAVLGLAREIRREIINQSPKHRRNIRLDTFLKDIKSLVSIAKEQRKGAVINTDIDRYRHQQMDLFNKIEQEPEIKDSKILAFKERWRLEIEGLDLTGTMLCGPIVIVATRLFLLGIESTTGDVLWRREIDGCKSRIQLSGRDGFVRVFQTGVVEMIDIHTGVLKWKRELEPRAGGEPVVLVVDQGSLPGLVIVVEEDKHLVALDSRTGETKWRYTVRRGGRFSLRRHGKLLYVSSGEAQLAAIDLEDGMLVWRFPDRTRFILPPAVENDIIVCTGGRIGRSDGLLYGINAYSGEKLWSTELKGGAASPPLICESIVILPITTTDRTYFVAYKISNGEQIWKIPCDAWGSTCSLIVLEGKLIVNLAGGVVRAIDVHSGQDVWNKILGPSCSDDIPLNLSIYFRGGALFVPADTIYVLNTEDGDLIHSLGGDPPVPDLLNINTDCSLFVAEESGHIGMYEIARSFRIIHGDA